MKRNIIVSNNCSQELLNILSSGNNALTNRESEGIFIMPLDSAYSPIFVQEHEDTMLISLDKEISRDSLWSLLMSNSQEKEGFAWKLPKDLLLEICAQDEEAIFKITEILYDFNVNEIKVTEEIIANILTAILILSEFFCLESVLKDMLSLPYAMLYRLVSAECEDVVEMYRELCL